MFESGWYAQKGIKVHLYRPDPVFEKQLGLTSICGMFSLNQGDPNEYNGEGWEPPACIDQSVLDIKRACKHCLRISQLKLGNNI